MFVLLVPKINHPPITPSSFQFFQIWCLRSPGCPRKKNFFLKQRTVRYAIVKQQMDKTAGRRGRVLRLKFTNARGEVKKKQHIAHITMLDRDLHLLRLFWRKVKDFK